MSGFNFRTVTLVGDSHYHREFIQQADRLTVAGKLVQYQPILDPVTYMVDIMKAEANRNVRS